MSYSHYIIYIRGNARSYLFSIELCCTFLRLCVKLSCRKYVSVKMVCLIKDKDDFTKKLNEAGGNLVIVDFFATWCGPCKMIAPKIEEFAAAYPDVIFLKVDVDECEEIAADYDITSMPTFVFIKNKAKVESFSGANDEKLKEILVRLK